jgi:hypothetical protein
MFVGVNTPVMVFPWLRAAGRRFIVGTEHANSSMTSRPNLIRFNVFLIVALFALVVFWRIGIMNHHR